MSTAFNSLLDLDSVISSPNSVFIKCTVLYHNKFTIVKIENFPTKKKKNSYLNVMLYYRHQIIQVIRYIIIHKYNKVIIKIGSEKFLKLDI